MMSTSTTRNFQSSSSSNNNNPNNNQITSGGGGGSPASSHRSSMRNFLRFNSSSSNSGGGGGSAGSGSNKQSRSIDGNDSVVSIKQNNKSSSNNDKNNDNTTTNNVVPSSSASKRNGFISTAINSNDNNIQATTTTGQKSSPLISRNYPHHRISKSPSQESSNSIVTTTTTTTQSSSSSKSSPHLSFTSINNTATTVTNNPNGHSSVINLNTRHNNPFESSSSFRHSFRSSSSGSNLFPSSSSSSQQQQQQQNYANQSVVVNQQKSSGGGGAVNNSVLSSANSLSKIRSNTEQFDHNYDNVASPPPTPPSSIHDNIHSPRFFDRKNFFRNSTTAAINNNNSSQSNSRNNTNFQSQQQQQQYGQILSKSKSNQSRSMMMMMKKGDEANDDDNIDDNDDDSKSTSTSKSDIISQTKQQQQPTSLKTFQWIEIMEPKSRTKMFANLNTGECRWAEPKGVSILRQSNPNLTQWWELYDQKSQKFYYYSVKDSKTIWQKPTTPDAVVVPLAKLQIIKQQNNSNNNAQPGDHSVERLISSAGSHSSTSSGHVTPSSPSWSSPSCLRCRFNQTKILVDSSTQTFSSPPEMTKKPSMISRWTQTTTQTPVNVRLDLKSSNRPTNALPTVHQPSLRHYLLSEARFAARGQTANANERIYDRATTDEGLYDPVANENYCPVYDDEDEIVLNDYDDYDDFEEYDDEESDEFSCDADDEYGGNSYSEDDDEIDEESEEESEELDSEGSEDELDGDEDYSSVDKNIRHHRRLHLLRQQPPPPPPLPPPTTTSSGPAAAQLQQRIDDHVYADYDSVIDYDDHHAVNIAQPLQKSSPQKHQASANLLQHNNNNNNNLDGLRMSASFTASDFKRNALGRSSYTPSMHHHHYPHAQQHQQSVVEQSLTPRQSRDTPNSLAKEPYSNPFNNTGSLRSSTGRISTNSTATPSSIAVSGGIADRIQLFNQKSTMNQRPSQQPISPPKINHHSINQNASIESPRGSLLRQSAESNGNQSRSYFREQLQKSSSTNQAPVHFQSNQSSGVPPSKSNSMTLISPSQSNPSNVANMASDFNITKISPNSQQPMMKRTSLTGKFPNNNNNNNFDMSIETSRNLSFRSHGSPLPIPSPPPTFNSPPTNNQPASGFQLQFNDAHKVMLNKSASAVPAASSTKDQKSKKDGKKSKDSSNKAAAIQKSKSKSSGKNKDKKQVITSPQNANNNSIESFARECVSRHRKGGIFSKKKTLQSMLIHTTKPLKKPMISTISDALLVKESVNCFKMIQIFMRDRDVSPSSSSVNLNVNSIENNNNNNLTSSTSSRLSPTPKYDEQQILVHLISVCVTLVPLRDEVLVQVARQVTQNPSEESERRGLELMCTLFWYFTASNKLGQHLHAFLLGHRNPFTSVVRRKFEQQMNRSRYTHSHLFYRKPLTDDEVPKVLRCVRSQHVGVFGETLADAVYNNNNIGLSSPVQDKNPIKNLPWPVVLLTEALLEPRHEDREGVFRCVGDMDDVHKLKMKLDTILPSDRGFEEMIGRATNNNNNNNNNNGKNIRKLTDDHDIHVIACTLKLYFRELRETIIPSRMYLEALDCAHDPQKACALLDRLPSLNRATLIYLIQFLQVFSTPEHVRDTKMDDANLSMVWAPNILRSPLTSNAQQTVGVGGKSSSQQQQLDSASIYEHTRAEMSFVRTLIQHLETRKSSLL